MKIVVIGGVALGASFATRMRRLSEEHEITIYEKSSFISYANCGLPYNLSGKIERKKLEISTPKDFNAKFNIKVNIDSEVTKINIQSKSIEIKNLKNGKKTKAKYDKLILGTGAGAAKLPIKGMDKEKAVFSLKNLNDLDLINKYVEENKPKKAVIFGAGFIGLEIAESLIKAGLDVSVVDIIDSIVKLDKDMSVIVENELVRNNIHLYLNTFTKEIDYVNKKIILKDDREIDYDIIFSTAGIIPNTQFIKEAGIKVDDKGIVITNRHMLTSNKDIYAGGDIVYSQHQITNKITYSPLAWGANRQVRVIANNIAGLKDEQPKTLNTAIIKVFRFAVSQTGFSEFDAKKEGFNIAVAIADLNNHAGYYPGSEKITVKIIYDKKTLKILGAQAIGRSADKKIDVISTLIRANQTIYDLQDLNLSYSPPYGSARDVLNILGSIAINSEQGKIKNVRATEIRPGAIIIDVRPKMVYELETIKGAINIPFEEIRTSKLLPKSLTEQIYLLCNTGHDSYNVYSILKNLGYKYLINIQGGYHYYNHFMKAKAYAPGEAKKNIASNLDNKLKVAVEKPSSQKTTATYNLDCKGLSCPGPLLEVYKKLSEIEEGDIIDVQASDFGFEEDIKSWTTKNKHTLLSVSSTNSYVQAKIQKGIINTNIDPDVQALAKVITQGKKQATIVLFSGNYDKAIAAFIIAQAAASLGTQVTIFATFWGLNALRVKPIKKIKKTFMNRRFAQMMPRGANKMKLSSMNMAGIGKKLIEKTMQKYNVKSPDEMMKNSLKMGVELIACTMSMELLGLTKDEIIEGATFAGVAKYVTESDDSNLTLFI